MIYVAADICTFALRFAGVLGTYDTAANDDQFEVALEHLNILLAEKTGTKVHWYLLPAAQEIPLVANDSDYELANLLSQGTPLMMIRDAWLERDGERTQLDLIRQRQFEEEYDPVNEVGTPKKVYITTDDTPTAYVLPTPNMSSTWNLVLYGIKYPTDIRENNGNTFTGFPDACVRWLSLQLAVDISAGVVTSLPDARFKRLKDMAKDAERAINRFRNRPNIQQARHTKFRRL